MTRYLAIALVLVAAGSVQAAEKKLDRTFTVAPGGSLTVEADGANVRVSGNDSNQVVVHIVARGSEEDLANREMDAVQKGDDVSVRLKQRKRSWLGWGSRNGEEKIEVTVPRRYRVDVQTSGGGVELRDTTGNASLNSSGGSINAKNVIGNVEARTSGGSIRVDTVRGDVDADTSGGQVDLLNIDGKIRGNSSGGGVRCTLVGANRGISATTSGGGIDLTVPRGTSGAVDLSTSGGGVNSDFSLTSSVKRDHELSGLLNGGGEEIRARTSGGSISLRQQ
jgi:DUF4097 and DUF4098 domain-containing protein YvlB